MCGMIKNKIHIKIIFKTYLKILKKHIKNIVDFQINFFSSKIKEQFLKIIVKNYFSKLF